MSLMPPPVARSLLAGASADLRGSKLKVSCCVALSLSTGRREALLPLLPLLRPSPPGQQLSEDQGELLAAVVDCLKVASEEQEALGSIAAGDRPQPRAAGPNGLSMFLCQSLDSQQVWKAALAAGLVQRPEAFDGEGPSVQPPSPDFQVSLCRDRQQVLTHMQLQSILLPPGKDFRKICQPMASQGPCYLH